MPPPAPQTEESLERGSASIELIGVLPFLFLAILVAGQLAIAGQTIWSAGIAARAGARAALVGGDAERVALRTLAPPLRRGARVGHRDGISVEVPVPKLLPVMPDFGVTATTRLGSGK